MTQELLRRDGYKDPEEVQRELQKKTAELRDEMDRRSREQEEAALERERLVRELCVAVPVACVLLTPALCVYLFFSLPLLLRIPVE